MNEFNDNGSGVCDLNQYWKDVCNSLNSLLRVQTPCDFINLDHVYSSGLKDRQKAAVGSPSNK